MPFGTKSSAKVAFTDQTHQNADIKVEKSQTALSISLTTKGVQLSSRKLFPHEKDWKPSCQNLQETRVSTQTKRLHQASSSFNFGASD
jgi:hypothetical protein